MKKSGINKLEYLNIHSNKPNERMLSISMMSFRKKVAIASISVILAYLTCILYPKSKNTSDIIFGTTTTTTPTPPELLMKWNYDSKSSNITIEKFDALKVHTKIMKSKIMRMAQDLEKQIFKKPKLKSIINDTVHMLYNNHLSKVLKNNKIQDPNNNTALNKTLEVDMILKNLKAARAMGAGVIYIEYPYTSVLQHTTSSEKILSKLFDLAPKYDVKISLIIKNYYKRNILTIRKDIVHFIKKYSSYPAMYRHKKDAFSNKLPVIYIMDSYIIPPDKWKEMLTPNGVISIRNSEYDVLALGYLHDEEHSYHIRHSHFDGFFTCCNNNGDSFGSTWKNWQLLSSWAKSHNLIWSAGVVEGISGVLTLKAGLNTILRCDPRPTFVFLNRLQFGDEIVSLAQTWTELWSNDTNKFTTFL